MWNKVEFSDLYKFITSIGLFFIASAFLVPWLFLNQTNGIQIPQNEYTSLTPKSQDFYEKRIDLSLWIINHLKYIFWILIIIGLLCIGIGLYFWIRKQKIKDQIEIFNRNILQFESLNPEATDIKREKDIKEELAVSEPEGHPEMFDAKTKSAETTPAMIDQLKQNLVQVEQIFFEKINQFNPFNYKPQFNLKVNDFVVDILLKSTIVSKYRDIYIEIKYLQQGLNFELFQKHFGQTVRLRNYVFGITNRLPKFYLFIVYRNDIAPIDEIQRFKKATNEYLMQFRDIDVQVNILSEEEAHNYNVKQIFG